MKKELVGNMSYDVITLDGKDYIIADTVNVDNIHYLYVINEELGSDDISILKQTNENGEEFIESITDLNEINKVMKALYEKDS